MNIPANTLVCVGAVALVAGAWRAWEPLGLLMAGALCIAGGVTIVVAKRIEKRKERHR